MANDELTAKQRLFISEYLKLGNITQAAANAGFRAAHVAGSRLLKNARIKNALEAARLDLRAQFVKEALEAFRVILYLMNNSKLDVIKFQCARDLLDRAGYRPIERREINGTQTILSHTINYSDREAVAKRLEELRERQHDEEKCGSCPSGEEKKALH